MAAKTGGRFFITNILILCILVLTVILAFVSNVYNFKTVFSHGPDQYFANICHFHTDCFCEVKSAVKLYEDIIPISKTGQKKELLTLFKGKKFKLKGYRIGDNKTWIAVSVVMVTDIINGYFAVPREIKIPPFRLKVSRFADDKISIDNQYFKEIQIKKINGDLDKHIKSFMNKLQQNVIITKVEGREKINRIRKKTEYKIISYISSGSVAYYCLESEYDIVESLYKKYVGNRLDTKYLQTSSFYYPGYEGSFDKNLFMEHVNALYFITVLPILLWIFLRVVLSLAGEVIFVKSLAVLNRLKLSRLPFLSNIIRTKEARVTDKLSKLKTAFELELISKNEFNRKKQEVLDQL